MSKADVKTAVVAVQPRSGFRSWLAALQRIIRIRKVTKICLSLRQRALIHKHDRWIPILNCLI